MATESRHTAIWLGCFVLACLIGEATARAAVPPPPIVELRPSGELAPVSLDTWWVHSGDLPTLRGTGDVLDMTQLTTAWRDATTGFAPTWQQVTPPYRLDPGKARDESVWWAVTQFSMDAAARGRALAVWVDASQAYIQVFVNGQWVGSRGSVVDDIPMLRSPTPPVFSIPASLLSADHPNMLVLYLRNPFLSSSVAEVSLVDPNEAPRIVFFGRTLWYMVGGAVAALLAAVMIYFLVWFFSHRQEYENIFLVLGIGGYLATYVCIWLPWLPGNGTGAIQMVLVSMPMSCFVTVYFQHRYRIHAHRYFVYGLIGIVGCASLVGLSLRDPRHTLSSILFLVPLLLASFVYGFYLNLRALRSGNREARVVLWGYAAYMLCTTIDMAIFIMNNQAGAFANSAGVTALAISIVISLARRFSHTEEARRQVVEDLKRRQELQEFLVAQIAEAAGAIEVTSGHILSSASQQQLGATEQSTAVEETRRTMESLLASGRTITMAAHDVLRNAETTQQHNHAVAQRIGESSNHSRRISEILDIIRDIANKTELLALNAALEGSRAGEAGRGFALVATQMQRLAENVMSAVADIKDLTLDIHKASGSTQATTLQAAQLASETTESAHKIGLIIQEQQVGTEQVTRAMDDVAKIAQQTALSGQTTLERTQALIEKARSLRALVDQHRTGPV